MEPGPVEELGSDLIRFRLQDFERNEARARTIGRQSQHKFAFISQKTIVGKTWFAKGDNDAAIEALEARWESVSRN